MTAPAYDQDSYRIRDDDGSEAAATWQAAKNAEILPTQFPGYATAFRVRFLVQETAGGMGTNFSGELRYSLNGGTYTTVSSSSNVVQATTGGGNLTQDNDTTQQLGAGTFVTPNEGQSTDGTVGGTMDFAGNDEAEFEFCIQLVAADLKSGDRIALRVYQTGGTPLGTYTNTPTIRVPLYTSVGAGTSHDTTLNISSASGTGPYSITVDSTANMVVGDAVWDSNGTPRKYLCSSVDSSTTATVIDTEGNGSAPTTGASAAVKRYYNGSTPLSDWESELDDTNKYASGMAPCAVIYNDAAISLSSGFIVNGGGTVGLARGLITVASGERHDGTDGTGALIQASGSFAAALLENQTDARGMDLEWVEFDQNGGGALYGVRNTDSIGCVCRTLIHSSDRNENVIGLYISTTGRENHFSNNLIFNLRSNHASVHCRGISFPATVNSDNQALNNTVHYITQDGGGDAWCYETLSDDANVFIKNCIGTDPRGTTTGTKQCWSNTGPTNATFEYNLSSDTSASGTGSLTSKASATQFTSATAPFDLHLKAGSDAEDAGTNLGVSPWGVQYDIDNEERSAPWDIGADKYTPAATDDMGYFLGHNQPLRVPLTAIPY